MMEITRTAEQRPCARSRNFTLRLGEAYTQVLLKWQNKNSDNNNNKLVNDIPLED